jgi:hypothetical protein
MNQQITRDNHYVPQWYQRGFLAKGRHKLYVLNLHPVDKPLPNGECLAEQELEELGPKLAFKERDLYTTRLGQQLNDEIETFLFGRIDKRGAEAVRAWIAGNHVQIHRGFHDFFEYLDAQKLRTPKGLDWILKHYKGLPQLELMRQMQALRQMHATMWSECVREIVSAAKSPVKFLVTDHPVTIYHPTLPPDAAECQYPGDPGVELVGSQTLFALDANHCLILTNLEYAEDPMKAAVLSRRTNARFRGNSMARTDAFIRGRELSDAEIHSINLVLKSRAKKYVAASNPEFLYPERHCKLPWSDIATTLLPNKDMWRFGGEIYIGYKDGTSSYRDKFGRTSKAHEFLTKSHLTEDPAPAAPCGCGSGIAFGDCCADVELHKRPSWSVMSIRERNLTLVRGINHILQLNEEKTWLDVRRNFSDAHVRRIHELFAALWPTDTRLIELLPNPQSRRSRALYLGIVDARTISTKVTGMLPYVDELVLVHPFINANGVRPEFSPIQQPAKFREQTLRDVFSLMLLEPDIRAGRVHLVPDPIDYDAGFRDEIMAITERAADKKKLGPIDKALARTLGHDEMMRFIKRLPPAEMKAYLKRRIADDSQELTDADIDSVVRLWKSEIEDDPFALLGPPSLSAEEGEFKIHKGFSRETGLFVATLTGSFIYTDSDTHWLRLHDSDGIHSYEPDPAVEEAVSLIANRSIEVPTLTYCHQGEPVAATETRALLRMVSLALLAGGAVQASASATAEAALPPGEEGLLTFKLRASVPLGGFQRIDVSRLVLTFGRVEGVSPVRLAVFLQPVSDPKPDNN